MLIPSEIPEKEESADISQNSSATTGSDVILQTVYAVGEEKNGKHWRQRKVELTLRNINDPDKIITLDVIEAPVITTAEIKPPDGKIKSQLKGLGISLMTHPSADQESISVLIEKVDINASQGERIYYIPHRAVLRKNHTSTKLRVVYDASSKDKNQKSLNDCLLQGPNLVPELLKVLLKFRLHRIVFTADIQKVFLQISVSCEDRDAMRFLWIHDDSNFSNPKVQIYRMCRVMFEAKSSTFLLSACIKHHLRKFKDEYPKTVELRNNYMYVDDLICGTNTEMEAIEVYHNANTIMKKASMTLAKWNSNSPVLRKEYETDKYKDSTPFSQDIIDFIQENEQTKRCVLKAVSRIFNPLGFLAPYVIQPKVFFQDLWRTGTDWDKPIPVELQSRWIKWHEKLKELPKIQIPRWYFCTDVETSHGWELHCFNDSSQSAYGSVVYLKFSHSDETKTTFVISKSRAAPLKKLSLPRLELMAALLGARLIESIREHFANAKVYMWTDSKIGLHWIKNNPRRWKTFVQNRVVEI
ncbi:hypothetical protein AVEN_190357-1 [Araneus ventricosus]|uniref:Reverse transcriptase domain-containing protein n=1 Tax=Araneus ventricosus TaxID=182803 RepID=A0A4Y2GSH1_ARAVE|nr:hypothetical protein AVEN_190357-1 [Araneus ventricosus]